MTRTTVTPRYENYASPADIRRDEKLSQAEKISLLESWAQDAEAEARASAEGMISGQPAPEESHGLKDIRKALAAVRRGG